MTDSPHSETPRDQPGRKLLRRIIVGFLLFIALFASLFAWQFLRPPAPVPPAPETTYVTSHVKKDGTIDYLAAAIQLSFDGVTPDNNAAVLLLQVAPATAIPDVRRQFYFRQLNVEPLPDISPFVNQLAYVSSTVPNPRDRPSVNDKFSPCMTTPWNPAEFPEVAGWIHQNSKALEIFVEASRRSRFAVPLFLNSPDELLVSAPLEINQFIREPVRILCSRAMLQLFKREYDAAAEDLLSAFRFSHLASQSPHLISQLISVSTAQTCMRATASLLHDPSCPSSVIERLRAQLVTPLPMIDFSRSIDSLERMAVLDLAQSFFVKRQRSEIFEKNASLFAGSDNEQIFRQVNQHLDAGINSFRIPRLDESLAALTELENAPDRKPGAAPLDIVNAQVQGVFGNRQPISTLASRFMISQAGPPFVQVRRAQANAQTRWHLLEISFALALHRAEHGSYPDSLNTLIPNLLKSLPEDPTSQLPFVYRKTADSYRLYSLGMNKKDDQGIFKNDGSILDDINVDPLPTM